MDKQRGNKKTGEMNQYVVLNIDLHIEIGYERVYRITAEQKMI